MRKTQPHIHPYSRRGAIPTYLLAIVLATLTLVSISIGSHLSGQRSVETLNRRQEEKARQALDAMALQWRLRDQCSLHAARLLARLGDLETARGRNISWSALSADVRRRLPGTRVWMFEYSSAATDAPPRVTDAPAGGGIGRQAMAQTFHHLVTRHDGKRRSEADERRMTKLLTTLFGNGMEATPLAQSLRGVPVRVFAERAQQYLVWDMITDGPRPLAGFILLVPDDIRSATTAMRLSATAVRDREIKWNGFIRCHPSHIGDLMPQSIRSSRSFAAWRARYRAIPFRERERSLPPWGETIGNHRIYTRIILNSSHLAFVLLPAETAPGLPFHLVAACFIFGLGCLLLLTRGLLLGAWPVVPLSWRFAGLYALACALPFSLAIQTFSGYVDERREALMQSLERRLSSTLAAIDQTKGQLQSRYLATFMRILETQGWKDAVRRHGVRAPGLTERILTEFSNASPSLPLSALFMFDMYGNELATGGSILTPEQYEGLHKYYKIYFINTLRNRYEMTYQQPPPGKNPLSTRDNIFWEAFSQISYTNITQIAEMRRGIPEFFKAGSHWLVKLHDFIQTETGEAIAFLIAWHDQFLDREAIRSALADYARTNPDGVFMAFRKERDRLVPLISASALHRRLLEHPANAAMARGGAFTTHVAAPDEWFVLARPSGAMRDVWLAAALPLKPELAVFEARRRRLAGFLLLSLTMVILLGTITAQHVVPSIISVKKGLTAVTGGDLDIRVELDRSDELGVLTRAFDEMTDGLRQRQRLSTFVSGTALQALSEGTTSKPRRGPGIVLVSDIRSFTTLCENQPAATITGMLNRHFDLMADIIHRHGGRIDRFIGDAIQAIFEPHLPGDEGLEKRAITAGLAMLREMEAINEERCFQGLFPYAIGVGLSSGDLLFGGIGDPAFRFEISVLGESVAEATGLEALSKSAPGLPLVMTPEIAKAGGALTACAVPLAGHEKRAFVYRADVTSDELLRLEQPEGDKA